MILSDKRYARYAATTLVLAALAQLVGCNEMLNGTHESGPRKFDGTTSGEGSVKVDVYGPIATLTATASEGWRFDHWDGFKDASTENPHNVSTARVGDYAAVFVRQFGLTVDVVGGGTVEVDGTTDVAPFSIGVDEGGERTLTAVDTNGWCFQEWRGDLSDPTDSNGTELTLTIEHDTAIEAVFATQVELTVDVEGTGSVEIEGGATVGADGADPVLLCPGSEQTLTAVDTNGWCLKQWLGALGDPANSNGNQLTITVEHDTAIEAVFVEHVELTVEVEGAGSVEISGAGVIGEEPTLVCPVGEHTLTAVGSNGWHFVGWSGELDLTNTNGNSVTVTVDRDTTVVAEFVQKHTLTLRLLDESTDEFISTSGVHDTGTEIPIEAYIPEGWEFDRWLVSEGDSDVIADASSPSTTVAVTRDMTVTSIVIDRTREHVLEILPDAGVEGVPFVEDATLVTLAALVTDCDFRLSYSDLGYFLACWSDLGDRPPADHDPFGGVPVRNTFFHGEAVVLSTCSYVIEAGDATFSGETAVSRWSGDASSATDTVAVIMDGDKTVHAIP